MTAAGTGPPPPARVLAAHPVLGALPAATLDELGARAREEVFAAGQAVVREGEPGDRLFLIREGRGEVTVATGSGPAPIAVVEPGDMIGEVALLSGTGRRQATITALSELRTVAIDFGALADLLARHPEIAADLAELTRRQRTARFLRRASPFTRLTKAQADGLAARLEHRTFGPGEDIVRQGEAGDACYVVVSGEVEVCLRAEDGRERVLTRLGVGALFGETALLTPAPRSATVRAAAGGGGPCEVVALHRDDFLAVVCADADLGRLMQEFVRLRYRPRRAEHVTAHPRATPDGDVIVTLRDERRLAYYRLSPEGWFLWQRLDGDRTLKDLTLDYFHEFRAFAPDRIAEILAGLARAGFVVGPAFRRELLDATGDGTGARAGGGVSAALRRGLDWRLTLRHVDGFFARVYDRGGWLLFTRPAKLLAAAVAAAGAVAFVHLTGRVAAGLEGADAAALLLVYPATVVVLVLHEFGHALATKAAGRRVNGAGVGWYWFAPIAFIDTSDMWLSDRRDRIAVSLAGPAVNLVLGGAAALAGLFLPGLAQQIAWQLALVCYIGTALNLNPLLEYDGYHVLVDVLDRPGLRRRTFAWLGRNLPGALFDRVAWRRNTVELVYGLSSALYVVAMAGVAFWLIRTFVEERLAPVLTPTGAAAVAWTAALLLALAALIGLWRDMRTADAG